MRKTKRRKLSKVPEARRDMNLWHLMGILTLFMILASFFLIVDDSNPLKIHVIIHFFLFMTLQSIAGFSGLYEKRIANGFFLSFKAIDIYTHIYGLFSFFLLFLAFFSLDPLPTMFLVFTCSLLFEGFEYFIEQIGHIVDKRRDLYKKTYTKHISEPKENIFQDIISNLIGISLGYAYFIVFL